MCHREALDKAELSSQVKMFLCCFALQHFYKLLFTCNPGFKDFDTYVAALVGLGLVLFASPNQASGPYPSFITRSSRDTSHTVLGDHRKP